MKRDLYASEGKFPLPDRRCDVAVVGGGSAGCAAAIEAARGGASVLLVDENPVDPGLIGLDIPLRYGGRATAAVQTPARMIERIAASQPLLAEAFEAGVDVGLGVTAWGAWVPGPAMHAVPARLLGLADRDRSWQVQFDELVVATGARDVAVGCAGADLPGVVGANALHALLTRYAAFAGQRIVVLGGGEVALQTALLALAHGLTVAAVIEAGMAATADLSVLTAQGIPVRLGTVPLAAHGGADGVTSLTVADIATGAQEAFACDTVCLAIGLAPTIELPSVLGCKMAFDAARGGHVPVLDAAGRTSLPFVRVVGDAAGVAGADALAHWLPALLATGGADVPVCLCEDVSRADLLGVHPPRYLAASAAGQRPLDPGQSPNPDHVKRLTRAGMGVCQGRRCRDQVAGLLALDSGVTAAAIPLASYRMPLRPLPLHLLSPQDEAPEVTAHWPIWYDIPSMFTPWREVAVEDTP